MTYHDIAFCVVVFKFVYSLSHIFQNCFESCPMEKVYFEHFRTISSFIWSCQFSWLYISIYHHSKPMLQLTPQIRHRILWKTKVMTQGSTTWTSIRGQEIPMMGEKLLKYDLNIVDLYELKWSELKWSEVKWIELNCELNCIWYNVYVIGHCLPANWHRWFNSLCRNWDWNSQSDGCAKVRRSGLCSGHMILPFMSFSFYKGIFKRIFRF